MLAVNERQAVMVRRGFGKLVVVRFLICLGRYVVL